MLILASVAFFLIMMSAVAGSCYWVFLRELAEARPVVAIAGAVPAEIPGEQESPRSPWWLRLLLSASRWGGVSPEQQVALRRDLAAAGLRSDPALAMFLGAKTISPILFPILCALTLYALTGDFFLIFPALLLSALVGVRLPYWYVRRLSDRRKKAINHGLPDLLDLLVISIESGLSLDHAIEETARDLHTAHPVLCDELAVFQLELRAGITRAEALRNLGTRTGEQEMRRLSSLLIQADRFGTSISRVLRNQARYMRMRRRQRAEELAHKVGVKMIFPIFFLIMPALFLVILGPAVLHIMASLGPSFSTP